MRVEIPQRLCKVLPAYLKHAAEEIPIATIDTDPRVGVLLRKRAEAEARHRREAEKMAERNEVVAQARDRLKHAGGEIARLESEFRSLARKFAAGECSDGDLAGHHRALRSWQIKADALRAGSQEMESELPMPIRSLASLANAVSELDERIEETRAEVAIDIARRMS